MTEPTEEQRKEATRAGIYENPETPGYHLVSVGGGIAGLGTLVAMCAQCGALIGNTENVRQVHTRWHEGISAMAEYVVEQRPGA